MRRRPLSEVIQLLQPIAAELVGDGNVLTGPDVVIDSRSATPGSLFIAIVGQRADGHDYADIAAGNGAAAVLGNRIANALPQVLCEDSVEALSYLARGIVAEERARGMLSIGVTGSSGKTSTKDLLAQVFETAGATVAPVGSQNNEVGVPLTACRVDEHTAYLISEMGSRGLGHISWLTGLVPLDIGICLNVGRAHVGEFGGIEVTAKAKSEIVAGLASDGWAVLNADDPQVAQMASVTRAKIAWFGEGSLPAGDLQVTARNVELNSAGQAAFELVVSSAGDHQKVVSVNLQLTGRHQVSNALAAAAAGLAAGLPLELIARSLSDATPRSPWRMELTQRSDSVQILNDAYNANPDSMKAALEALKTLHLAAKEQHPQARAIAVLGDMLELGEQAHQQHVELGQQAALHGVAEVIAVGTLSEAVVLGAAQHGVVARSCQRSEVSSVLELFPGDVVLVKGSRGIGLEVVAAELVQEKE